MEMSMENPTGEMILTEENSDRILSRCPSVHHRSHIYWPGFEPVCPRREAGDWPPEAWYGCVKHKVHFNNIHKFISDLTVNTLHLQYQYVPTNYRCVGMQQQQLLLRCESSLGCSQMLAGRRLAGSSLHAAYWSHNAGNQLRRKLAVGCEQYAEHKYAVTTECGMGGTYSYHCAVKYWL